MLAIPLILALLTGFALVELLYPRQRTRPTGQDDSHRRWPVLFELLLRLSLGLGFGLSLQSILAYVSLLNANSLIPGLVAETIVALAAAVNLTVRANREITRRRLAASERKVNGEMTSALGVGSPSAVRDSVLWHDRLFTLSLIVSAAVLATLPVLRWSQAPHGYWDAWSMWTPKAMILYRGGEEWTERISSFHSHPGYPLLVPLTTARLWTWVGTSFQMTAAFANSYAYALSTIGTLIGVTGLLGGKRAAALAAAALCAVPAFPAWTAALYADIQVSFHVLAATAILGWAMTAERNVAGLLTLAGIAVGGFLWSKNEGMMLAVAAIPALSIMLATQPRGWRGALPATMGVVLGTAPFVICLGHFKYCYAPQGDLTGALISSDLASTVFAADRWETILASCRRTCFQERLPIIATLCLAFACWRQPERPTWKYLALASFPFFACLGYVYVYLRTPHNLTWHLASSISRLFVHVLPSMLAVFVFLCLGDQSEQAKRKYGFMNANISMSRTAGLISGFGLAVFGILAFVAPSYQTLTRNQAVDPANWRAVHRVIASTRLERLGRWIGESERVSIHSSTEKELGRKYPFLVAAQYFLMPRKVAIDIDQDAPWVIAFHRSQDDSRKFSDEQQLTLVHDLRNGLRLYHRGPLKSNTASSSARTLR
jgi:hypothetical protein